MSIPKSPRSLRMFDSTVDTTMLKWPEATSLEHALAERAERRRLKRRYVFKVPYLEDVKKRAILGTWSITTDTVKYLDPDSLIQVFGDVSDTVSAAVRDYVTVTQAPTLPRTDN